MVLAEWQVGEVFWALLWFFLFFMWIWLVISIFADIIRSDDMGGWAKALWAFFIIFLPFLGVFIYLIVRGGSMADRSVEQVQQQQAYTDEYIRSVAGTDADASAADELQKLSDLHAAGTLSDDEYAAMKAKVIG